MSAYIIIIKDFSLRSGSVHKYLLCWLFTLIEHFRY